jgi:uncharacterized membrane protein
MLLAAQALGTAAVIFPAARLARRRLSPLVGDGVAFAAALSVYLIPTVTRCVDYDFHPSTMAITPLFWFIDALDEGDWKRAWTWFFAALAFREDVGLQGAAVALTFLVLPRERGDVGGVLGHAFADPGALARYLVSGDRKLYLVWLLATVAFLPLASPRWLFGALPLVAINLLSDVPGVRAVQAH